MGNNACNPSSETIQSLFSLAQENGIIPDISLDGSLASYLSLSSAAALQDQYESIQQRLSPEQLTLFSQNVSSTFGTKVAFGNVGVVALALSIFLDLLANQMTGQDAIGPIQRITASDTSRIGSILREYMKTVPEVVNDNEKMADVTEICDQNLKIELIRLFEGMTLRRRVSSAAIKQWLNGAAIHLHIRIHGIRLGSVPRGSAESLRLSYRTGFPSIIRRYTSFLQRNLRETPPSLRSNTPGLLVIEPQRNVTHWVKHSLCQSEAIAAALLTQILAAQGIQSSEDFLDETGENMAQLIEQRGDFEFKKQRAVS